MSFYRVILANLTRRPARTCFAVLGLATSIGATAALMAIAWNYASSKLTYYLGRGVDIVVVRAGVSERITSSLNEGLVSLLSSLPQVEQAEGAITEMVALGNRGLVGVPLRGVDPAGFIAKQYSVRSGRALNPADRSVVLLGAGLAESLEVAPGQRVTIEGHDFDVVGVFSGADALEANTAVAPRRDVQQLMDRPNQVSEICIAVDPHVDAPDMRQLCREIEAMRNAHGDPLGFHAMPTRDYTTTDTETGLLVALGWGTTLIASILSFVGTLNTMLMSVLERTAELGLLRAVGWPPTRVLRMILGETLLLWLWASLCGILLAYGAILVLAAHPLTKTVVRPDLPLTAIVTGCSIGLIAALCGAIYPAWCGARVSPAEAIRYE